MATVSHAKTVHLVDCICTRVNGMWLKWVLHPKRDSFLQVGNEPNHGVFVTLHVRCGVCSRGAASGIRGSPAPLCLTLVHIKSGVLDAWDPLSNVLTISRQQVYSLPDIYISS